jgi:hypothetical protein
MQEAERQSRPQVIALASCTYNQHKTRQRNVFQARDVGDPCSTKQVQVISPPRRVLSAAPNLLKEEEEEKKKDDTEERGNDDYRLSHFAASLSFSYQRAILRLLCLCRFTPLIFFLILLSHCR